MNSADECAAAAGDEAAFTALTRRHRRELHVHCYRMLASFEDAEDLVQETFLRAWQKRDTFEGRASFRAWLYRIATNACLDFLARHERRVVEIAPSGDTELAEPTVPHVAWLQPYPDRLIESADGESAVLRRETIELAYLVALQHLPPKQRAVLILRDVLDWSASETASLLESTVPAVNGALQRARATLRQHRPAHDDVPPEPPERERALLQQYVEATERCDVASLTSLLSHDARFSMPPNPFVFVGAEPVMQSMVEGGFGEPPYDDWRCLLTRANGLPAVACYLRKERSGPYEAFAVDVLRIEHGAVVEITGFSMENLTDAFGLPRTLA
jgi:RNA polymerase sigma-70 factor (ECF subfamily)